MKIAEEKKQKSKPDWKQKAEQKDVSEQTPTQEKSEEQISEAAAALAQQTLKTEEIENRDSF